jgi:hypothetical protein
MLESVLLFGAESIDEVKRRIKDFLSLHQGEGFGSSKKWLRGVGWDQTYFGGLMPTAVCPLHCRSMYFMYFATNNETNVGRTCGR